MTRKSSRETSGFTLIELLVVIGIISVVMAIGTSTFYSVMAAWNERQAIAELDAQADIALESIGRDIADALSHEVAGTTILGESSSVKDSRSYPAAEHPDDVLVVPIRAIDPNRPLAVPANVGYRVERSNVASGVLIRSVGPLGAEFPTTNRIELIPNAYVLGFSVEFLGSDAGALWASEWSGPRLPVAIRVSLALEDVDRPNQFQIARQAVFPVRVQ
jgi:prepilin-type N-terminal cleavage/methylation domain-containing protein